MSSPIPPDPYVALGVSSTADLNTIRIAHRKLVLKHHPDRIRDEADREKGKAEFQKVQQAYELLSDSNRRARYDDQIKLAELRKEKMMRESSNRSTVSASRASPPGMTVRREMRGDHYFEERAPREDSYDNDYHDEPLSRALPRKRDSYEKRPIPTPRASERKEKPASKWDRPVAGMSFDMAFRLKQKAAQVKERAARENAHKAEMRDKEKRRDRSDKQSSRKAAYVEDEFSGSESDTVVPNHSSRSEKPSLSRSRTQVDQEFTRRSAPQSRRSSHEYKPEYYSDEDKWERHHAESRDYIVESQKRPTLSRTGSDAYVYWKGDQGGHRRSSGENDKRPSSSRRVPADNNRPRPSMAAYSSAPDNLRPHVVDREPVRAKTVYPADRPMQREPPGLARAQTMPVPRGGRKENNAPVRGSNLKHTETQPDSGYYSSSNPHTPEMRGESPPGAKDFPREPPIFKRQQSTRYAIVDEAESDEDAPRRHRVTKISTSDEDDSRRRRYRSPVSEVHDRDYPRERNERPRLPKLDTDIRPRPTRATESRTSVPRTEFQSSRGSPSVPRKQLFNEMPPPEERNYRYDPTHLKTAPHRGPANATYASYRTRSPDDDYSPSSRFKEGLEGGGRRSSPQYA